MTLTPSAARRSRPSDSPPLAPLTGKLGGPPRRRQVGHVVHVVVELARGVQPREDVAPAVGARHAGVAAGGEDDVAAGAPQLGGDLLPRGPGADHEHAALRQPRGPAVARGVQLVQERRCVRRDGRDARHVAVARGDDHVARVPVARVGDDEMSPPAAADAERRSCARAPAPPPRTSRGAR